MELSNLLSGLLGALLGSAASFGAVVLDHHLRERAQQKRTLNSLLGELGSVRRSLEAWIERRRSDWSWKEGGPHGVRPSLRIVDRLPVEIAELPTEITRQLERVERKLTVFYETCNTEFANRLTSETPIDRLPENEPGLKRVVTRAEHAIGEIKLAEAIGTKQWDAWQVPLYKRPIRFGRAEVNYQGPRRIPGYDSD